jgi:hypothetical protein
VAQTYGCVGMPNPIHLVDHAGTPRDDIRRLIINEPPRHLKLHLASVAFPAWCLGHGPSLRMLCVSYAQDLADKLARDFRPIMMSEWYQRLFATRLSPQRQAVTEFETIAQGCRSQTQRQAANDWYDQTLYSRLSDTRTGAIILIMHRLHEACPRA